jgi:hypothetical protein
LFGPSSERHDLWIVIAILKSRWFNASRKAKAEHAKNNRAGRANCTIVTQKQAILIR